MEKKYLAGFGSYFKGDALSDCRGYFRALKDEKILNGEVVSGRVLVGGKDTFEVFSEIYGKDEVLWRTIQKKTGDGKAIFYRDLIRGEFGLGGEERFRKVLSSGKRLKDYFSNLSVHYPSLEFFIYSSDLEAKS